jgi:homoserine dehydrogenase
MFDTKRTHLRTWNPLMKEKRMKQLRIGLLGLGTIGSGVARMLLHEGKRLSRKIGVELVLARIAEINPKRARELRIPAQLVTTNADKVITDPGLDVIIELIGGIHPAREFILKALAFGKHVVTANKAVLAAHGREIFSAARKARRCVTFEASVGGGIPIIAALRDGFVANRIESIFGIVNGTTNYILTQMTSVGARYEDVLAEAQRLGYAERDPSSDVEGYDSTNKLVILAKVGFGVNVDAKKIYREGIVGVQIEDIQDAYELGYTLKLLAIGKRGRKLDLRVHPTLLPHKHPLASIHGVFNAICVTGNPVGETMLYGRGAGQQPTTSAVLADVVDIALGRAQVTFASLDTFADDSAWAPLLDIKEITCRYFLHFTVVDRYGVLAKICGVMGKYKISIASVVQPERRDGNTVPLIMMTHKANEGAMRKALAEIDRLDVVRAKSRLLRVES